MTICKKGICHSSVIISSSIYSCSSCGHTEIVQGTVDEEKECSKCHSKMKIISSHAEIIEDFDTDNTVTSDNI